MSKIEETIDKAAKEYYANEVVAGDTVDDKSGWMDCFKAGAEWMLSHQWRSVEEELPKNDDDVVVMEIRGNYPCLYYIAWHNGKQWCSNDNNFDKDFIEYWMPIPPLPEERKEGGR